MDKIKERKKQYHRYQVRWMFKHGLSLKELAKMLKGFFPDLKRGDDVVAFFGGEAAYDQFPACADPTYKWQFWRPLCRYNSKVTPYSRYQLAWMDNNEFGLDKLAQLLCDCIPELHFNNMLLEIFEGDRVYKKFKNYAKLVYDAELWESFGTFSEIIDMASVGMDLYMEIPSQLTENLNNMLEAAMGDNKKEKLTNGLIDNCWDIILLIGSEGCSTTNEISNKLYKLRINEGIWHFSTYTQIKYSLSLCCESGILTKSVIESPLFGLMNIYRLAGNGEKAFHSQFGQKPVESEIELLKQRYGSVVRGYEVKYVADAIRKSGCCCYVSDKTDYEPVGSWLPDITCKYDDKKSIYIKYESCKCSQEEFSKNCESMAKSSKDMYFIIPSVSHQQIFKELLSHWIYKMDESFLEGLHIFAATAPAIQDKNIWVSDSWEFRCDPLDIKTRAKAKK